MKLPARGHERGRHRASPKGFYNNAPNSSLKHSAAASAMSCPSPTSRCRWMQARAGIQLASCLTVTVLEPASSSSHLYSFLFRPTILEPLFCLILVGHRGEHLQHNLSNSRTLHQLLQGFEGPRQSPSQDKTHRLRSPPQRPQAQPPPHHPLPPSPSHQVCDPCSCSSAAAGQPGAVKNPPRAALNIRPLPTAQWRAACGKVMGRRASVQLFTLACTTLCSSASTRWARQVIGC